MDPKKVPVSTFEPDPKKVPVSTFDPLLRDLLYWGLLARVDKPAGPHWELAERAVRRLDEIAAESRASEVGQRVFLDRGCAVCGLRRLTRLRDSRYVCDECWSKADQRPSVEPTVIPAGRVREHHWIAPWRQRSA